MRMMRGFCLRRIPRYARFVSGRHTLQVLTIRMSCEHHRTDFEGPFFNSLLIAAGGSGDVLKRSITVKRQELIRRLRERLAARSATSWRCSAMRLSGNRETP